MAWLCHKCHRAHRIDEKCPVDLSKPTDWDKARKDAKKKLIELTNLTEQAYKNAAKSKLMFDKNAEKKSL